MKSLKPGNVVFIFLQVPCYTSIGLTRWAIETAGQKFLSLSGRCDATGKVPLVV